MVQISNVKSKIVYYCIIAAAAAQPMLRHNLLFIIFLFSIRNGIPVFHLPKLPIFIAVTPLMTEIFKFLYYDIIDQDSSGAMSMNNRFYSMLPHACCHVNEFK